MLKALRNDVIVYVKYEITKRVGTIDLVMPKLVNGYTDRNIALNQSDTQTGCVASTGPKCKLVHDGDVVEFRRYRGVSLPGHPGYEVIPEASVLGVWEL
jgi:hypothetical protein